MFVRGNVCAVLRCRIGLMDKLDREILGAMQDDFPIAQKPYDAIAARIGIETDQLWSRVEAMLQDGLIRRIGVSIDSRKIGYSSTLAAVRVGDEQVDAAAEVIGSWTEVTHSYQRDDEFNIWFTLIACDEQRIEYILEQVRSKLGLKNSDLLNVPVKRLFKLDARFGVLKETEEN